MAGSRGIKGCKNLSKKRLLSALNESESAQSEKNLRNARIKQIREEFNKLRDRFLKPKMKEIKRNLHDFMNISFNLFQIKNKKNLSKSKIIEIGKNLLELEGSLSKLKKCYDYDDIEYKGVRDVGNLFNMSVNEDYYKPIRTINVFDHRNNFMEYEIKGDKDKILSVKEYLDMIRPYLSDIMNDHKIQGEWKVHSGNKVIDYKTKGEWKIHLTMTINFIFLKTLMKLTLCVQQVTI